MAIDPSLFRVVSLLRLLPAALNRRTAAPFRFGVLSGEAPTVKGESSALPSTWMIWLRAVALTSVWELGAVLQT